MTQLTKRILVGSAAVLGLAVVLAMAQHGGVGHEQGQGHEGHRHGEKLPLPAKLPECPVMDEPISLAVSTPTDEGPVFFCCEDCISKFQKNPSKYAAKVETQRKALAGLPKVQVTCPVSREPVDQEVFIVQDGKKVYFCCKHCVRRFQSDPAKYASALANSYTHQTKCPVTKEDIDPEAFAAADNGMKIYFCCPQCEGKFFSDPAKYASNLAAQGFTVDPKEMTQGEAPEQKGGEHGSHGHGDHDHNH